MEELLNKLYEYFMTYGLNVLAAILIFIIGRWMAKLVSKITEKLMDKAKVEKTLSSFAQHLIYIGLMVFVIIAAINKLGVETTSIIAVVGAAGLAVGLALQGSLANFAAGIMIILFKPFKVGDVVQVDGIVGVIKEIQIFNTIMNTPDNRKIIFPNAKVTSDKIANLSGVANRRVDLVFGISYSDDIKKAKEVLRQILDDDSRVLKDPAATIGVSELGDSSVNIVCRPWVKPSDYWDVYFDITEKGKIELEKNGMTIPFPQRDVHLFEEKKIKE